MGWTYPFGYNRKQMIAERVEGWERQLKEHKVKATALAHCYRGNVFSGVLWVVWEHQFILPDNTNLKPPKRFIECDLLEYAKQYDGWGYKDMDESMGPCYYSCPLGYLKMVPVVASAEWREYVHQYHARQQAKRKAKREAKRKGMESMIQFSRSFSC